MTRLVIKRPTWRGGHRARAATAVAASLSITMLAACAQTDGGEPASGADSDVASALQKEGEVAVE